MLRLGLGVVGFGRVSGRWCGGVGGMRFYGERRYAQTHEWLDVETGEVGVSKYALQQGEVVYLELPEEGTEVNQGDECGEVASVKSSSPLIAPVGGEIIDVNKGLEDDLGPLNEGTNNEGMSDSAYIFKLKISNEGEIEGLMDEEKYKELVAELEE